MGSISVVTVVDNSKYKSNPKATVGTPMKALKNPLITHLPLKE
jgi:hypothetical protein